MHSAAGPVVLLLLLMPPKTRMKLNKQLKLGDTLGSEGNNNDVEQKISIGYH